jgi:hypothetical protein
LERKEYKVLKLFEIYNFGFGRFSIRGRLKNSNFTMQLIFSKVAQFQPFIKNQFLEAARNRTASKNGPLEVTNVSASKNTSVCTNGSVRMPAAENQFCSSASHLCDCNHHE